MLTSKLKSIPYGNVVDDFDFNIKQYYFDDFQKIEWDKIKIYRPSNLLEFLEIKTYDIAFDLLTSLRTYNLNIVTVESLTAGMISKMLVDIPTFGPFIYGGFIVHDSDAKRMFVKVNTPDVYTHETAKQMAEGALDNSRAMVALAVTGKAGPFIKSDMSTALGVVHIGVSIRSTNNRKYTNVFQYNAGDETIFKDNWPFKNYDVIERSKDEFENNKGACPTNFMGNCSTLDASSRARDIIRLLTVLRACEFATKVLKDYDNQFTITTTGKMPSKWDDKEDYLRRNFGTIPAKEYDGLFKNCGEPSGVIETYLKDKPTTKYDPTNLSYNPRSLEKDCPPLIREYGDSPGYNLKNPEGTESVRKINQDGILQKIKGGGIKYRRYKLVKRNN